MTTFMVSGVGLAPNVESCRSRTLFATPELATKLNKDIPHNSNGAPLLMPSEMTVVQSRLLKWFDKLHVYLQIVASLMTAP